MNRFSLTKVGASAAGFLFFLSCGGGGSEPRSLQITIAEPAELSSLASSERGAAIEFYDATSGEMMASTYLTPAEDGSGYTGSIDSLPSGSYLVRLWLLQNWDPATVTASIKAEESGEQVDVGLAVFETTIEVVKGEETIVLGAAPSDFSLSIDDDGDGLSNLIELTGTTNPLEADTDGDGVSDSLDVFPNLSSEFGDGDGDGIGDNIDNCYTVSNADQADNDSDFEGDLCDADDDNDGLADSAESAAGTDPFDPDSDDDTLEDGGDNCLLAANTDQADTDGDGSGNACDSDDDNDGIADTADNCPFFASTDQTDSNGDGVGDVCTGDDDGDGIADASDNCRTVSNIPQTDTDGDGAGNACDTDDDNDGLSDTEETTPGADNLITNRLLADTDGDGITDPNDNCRITANANQASSGDADGEGDACDCSPNDGAVRTVDAVFVSADGNDSASGARNDPVRTITRGLALAQAGGKTKVYVEAGTYNETVSMANGISVYGGFNLSADWATCQKALASGGADANTTRITSAFGPVVAFTNITAETRLEGVTVEGTASSGGFTLVSVASASASSQNLAVLEDDYLLAPDITAGSTTAVSVSRASPLLVNTVIDAGDSQESTAVSLTDSPAPKLVNNTVRGGASLSTSTAVHSLRSVPSLVNNILFTEGGLSQRVLYFQDSSPSNGILLRNNLLFGVQGLNPDAPKLYQNLSPSLQIYTTIAPVNSLDGNAGGGNFHGNIRLTADGTDAGGTLTAGDLLQNAPGGNFRLQPGALAIDAGVDPLGIVGMSVTKDRDGNARPNGVSHDLGAFERVP